MSVFPSYDADESVFISYAEEILVGRTLACEGARLLIQGLLEEDFINDVTAKDMMEDQTILAPAFKQVVDALRRRKKGSLDPRQVVRAYLAGGWLYCQSLSDDEWEVANDNFEEIDALRSVCEPHDGLNNDDEGYPRGEEDTAGG